MQKKPNMGVWSFSERNSGGGQRRPGSLVDREAGKGLAFKDDREAEYFFSFWVSRRASAPAHTGWRAAGPS